ncbi:MAG TPA: hypothetical protein VEI06_08065 [Gemmatimonadaceae bacterium]|nr:hypothetical protein [Gemmatimonadaceae bacterium]
MRWLMVGAVIVGAIVAASCGNSSTGPANREFNVVLEDTHEFFDSASGEYIEEMVLSVRAGGDTLVASAVMYYEVSTGTIESADATSDPGGIATVSWALTPTERAASPAPALQVCANEFGGSSCGTVETFPLSELSSAPASRDRVGVASGPLRTIHRGSAVVR